MPSNASKAWSGTHKELAAKRDKVKKQIAYHTEKHQQQDLLDQGHDEEIQRQQQRHCQAIETLNQAADKIDDFLENNEPRMGKGKRKTEVKSKVTTSKGTIQGYNGIATVDKRHQIVVHAQAFGEGQEHHTLQPILEGIKTRFNDLGMHEGILSSSTLFTADTGFANVSRGQIIAPA